MPLTIAFDIYGTLTNPHGVVERLGEFLADAQRARVLSAHWREKQLEYAYRRALMRDFCGFFTCTQQALDYADARLQTQLTAEQKTQVLGLYQQLPPYADTVVGLEEFAAADVAPRLYAFSNGAAKDIATLLNNVDINHYFADVVSAEDVRTFKPDPAVYQHFTAQAQAEPANTWLVSGNPFDILGAAACGWQTAWVQRDASIPFDPWQATAGTNATAAPTLTVNSLAGLAGKISSAVG